MTKLKRTTHKAQGFSEEQTQGYCLLPHHHSAIAITNRLTGSQFRLWHYLMMIDPFADRNRKGEVVFHDIPSPTEIGKAIGSSPRTVEKDMERLEELGLYEKRIKSWQGYNLTAEEGRKISERMKQKTPKPLQDKGGYLTEDAAKQPDSGLNNRNLELEPLPDKDSGAPQTYSNYSNFIHTLSEDERESFLEFGRKKATALPHPPELPNKWIAANFTELYKQFLVSPAGREAKQEAIASKYNWENDPRLMDWLHKAYYVGHPWTQEDEAEREERFAFLMWAQKTNAYAGRIADEPA